MFFIIKYAHSTSLSHLALFVKCLIPLCFKTLMHIFTLVICIHMTHDVVTYVLRVPRSLLIHLGLLLIKIFFVCLPANNITHNINNNHIIIIHIVLMQHFVFFSRLPSSPMKSFYCVTSRGIKHHPAVEVTATTTSSNG